MWKCHKCGKPVYFAERKQSLGYDWHPECLRCEECGKRLNPGQHAEHKGVPYCHVPCYGALFGPQLFGHGTRVESHKSYGQQRDANKFGKGPNIPRAQIENKLKLYNQFFDGRSGEIRSREVNGRLILEGSLRIHWGVQGVIHLKEDDDQRTVVTIRKRNSCRLNDDYDSDDDSKEISRDSSYNDISLDTYSNLELDSSLSSLSLDDTGSVISYDVETDQHDSSPTTTTTLNSTTLVNGPSSSSLSSTSSSKSSTLPPKLDLKSVEWDELDDLLQVERKTNQSDKPYRTMPSPLPSRIATTNSSESGIVSAVRECIDSILTPDDEEGPIENGNQLNRSMSGPDCLERLRYCRSPEFDRVSMTSANTDSSRYVATEPYDNAVVRRPKKTGSTAIKRRPGRRLSRSKVKRRCSINGHFYNRETSFFTPPHGSQMSVWVTSLASTQDVVNLILEKYKVESDPVNFALFVVHDNGEQKRLKDEDYPLLARVLQGPHEDVVRIFLMDSQNTPEVSNEVAQFLNLSSAELRAILNQYTAQEDRETLRIQEKYYELKRRIKQRMDELKVRL